MIIFTSSYRHHLAAEQQNTSSRGTFWSSSPRQDTRARIYSFSLAAICKINSADDNWVDMIRSDFYWSHWMMVACFDCPKLIRDVFAQHDKRSKCSPNWLLMDPVGDWWILNRYSLSLRSCFSGFCCFRYQQLSRWTTSQSASHSQCWSCHWPVTTNKVKFEEHLWICNKGDKDISKATLIIFFRTKVKATYPPDRTVQISPPWPWSI